MFGFYLQSYDVTAAFLEGKNDYKNFARIPEGFGKYGGQRVEVIGNFYGEKQGPKIWNDHLNNLLENGDYNRIPAHPCMYTKEEGEDFMINTVHVDDGLVVSNSVNFVKKLEEHLKARLRKITFKTIVTKYIGINIDYDQENRVMKLSHSEYIEENFKDYNKKVGIPMSPHSNLRAAEPIVSDKTMLHDTGKFRYVGDRARPDLLLVAGEIANRGHKNPSLEHEKVSERTKNFLNETRMSGLTFSCCEGNELEIFAYSDASYITAGNCKSRLGGCIFMNKNSGAIRSFSRNDTIPSTLSHSTAEVEIKAIDETIREIVHVLDILESLFGKRYDKPVKIFVDNEAAIRLCSTLKQSHKVNHINLRIHYIREMIKNKVLV